jgi:holliday junction DNA helicase RuvA
MIGRLSGTLIEKQAPYLLIDVGGVGYEVQAPMTSIYPLPELGAKVVLHTHLSISENAHQLFAFYTLEERLLFRTLIKVSGVGPKMALAILSGMAVDDFVYCVKNDNVEALVKVPGVGKKTAERLIIEVKDRLKNWDTTAVGGLSASDSDNAVPAPSIVSQSSIVSDAESALIALGYKPTQASQMIMAAQKLEVVTTSEALIRLALKNTQM